MSTLDKVKVFRKPDGSFITVYFLEEAMLSNETEDQFIERTTNKLRLGNDLENLPEFETTKTILKQIISSDPKGHKRRLRVDLGGNISIDATVKLDEELKQELKDSIKLKLGLGQPLNNNEIDALIKNI